MEKKDLRIVYMGTPEFAVESLRALVEGGYNVVGVITMPDKPMGRHGSVLQQSEVNRILGKVDEMLEENEDVVIPFTVGEAVKVTEGPFSGFSGVVEEVNNEKKKLTVTVKVFGRNTPLALSFMQVEKE